MEITVAIVCSNDVRIAKCLNSIPKGVRIIVVLNNPTDEVMQIIVNDNRVETLRFDELNLGYLRQLAADNAKTPGIVYIDSDCEFEEKTIEYVSSELEKYAAVSIPLRFKSNSFSTKIVARCRTFTTPDDALFMPAAFRVDIQKFIGGYLYDKRLSWGEDGDQKKRLENNNIDFCISEGVIWHRALNFYDDAQSAMRLGVGRLIREKNGLSRSRVLWKDVLPFRDIKLSIQCAKLVGLLPALYHLFVWRPSYKYGYWKEVFKNGH